MYVRHTGPVAVPLDRPDPLTVRPAPGFAPVLAPAADAVFRVSAGAVTLDGLAFDLRGRPAARAAVTATGGRLTLRGCTVTLAEADAADGPLVAVGPGPGGLRVELSRVTAALTGPAVDLRVAGPRPDRPPLEVTADRCVFAGVGPEPPAPVAAVAGPFDPLAPLTPGRWLRWAAPRPNRYAPRPTFLRGRPDDLMADPLSWPAGDWLALTGEPRDEAVSAVRFAAPLAVRRLTDVGRDDLQVVGGPPVAD